MPDLQRIALHEPADLLFEAGRMISRAAKIRKERGLSVEEMLPKSILAGFVKAEVRSRAERKEFLGADLFLEPTWDILLNLYVADCEGRVLSITELSDLAFVSENTGLRVLQCLERLGHAILHPHNCVSLSTPGREAMVKYLTARFNRLLHVD